MDKKEEYRRLAAECVQMAAATADFQFKAIWIDMARAWLKLADQAEKNSRADLVYETPAQPLLPGSAVPPSPVHNSRR